MTFSDSVFVGDRNQISVEEEEEEEEEETPVWYPTEQEFNENDMELIDVLADITC